MRKVMFFCLFVLPVPTWATSILVLYTPTAIYIASDSQISKTDGSGAQHGCKIHVGEHFVWASSGLLYETAGTFDIREIAKQVLRKNDSFTQAMDQLNKEITAEYPGIRNRAISLGAKPGQATIHLVLADKDSTQIGMISAHGKSVDRMDCPGKTCNTASGLFELGEHGEIDRILNERHGIWKERGIEEALNYLIAAQEHKTPRFVSGPIAVVELADEKIKWIQRGACATMLEP